MYRVAQCSARAARAFAVGKDRRQASVTRHAGLLQLSTTSRTSPSQSTKQKTNASSRKSLFSSNRHLSTSASPSTPEHSCGQASVSSSPAEDYRLAAEIIESGGTGPAAAAAAASWRHANASTDAAEIDASPDADAMYAMRFALVLLVHSASAGYLPAMGRLGRWYLFGLHGVERDVREGMGLIHGVARWAMEIDRLEGRAGTSLDVDNAASGSGCITPSGCDLRDPAIRKAVAEACYWYGHGWSKMDALLAEEEAQRKETQLQQQQSQQQNLGAASGSAASSKERFALAADAQGIADVNAAAAAAAGAAGSISSSSSGSASDAPAAPGGSSSGASSDVSSSGSGGECGKEGCGGSGACGSSTTGGGCASGGCGSGGGGCGGACGSESAADNAQLSEVAAAAEEEARVAAASAVIAEIAMMRKRNKAEKIRRITGSATPSSPSSAAAQSIDDADAAEDLSSTSSFKQSSLKTDENRAYRWYLRSAALEDSADTQVAIGNVCMRAEPMPRIEEGLLWYQLAARVECNQQQQEVDGSSGVGGSGSGAGASSTDAAADSTSEAAAQQQHDPHPDALFNLGTLYWEGIEGHIEPDTQRSLFYFETAANLQPQPDNSSLFFLGALYRTGNKERGVRPNIRKCLRYLELAAGSGHTGAQLYLAQLWRNGDPSIG